LQPQLRKKLREEEGLRKSKIEAQRKKPLDFSSPNQILLTETLLPQPMSEQDPTLSEITEEVEEGDDLTNDALSANKILELKQIVDGKAEAVILCETSERNPNFLSIIYANKTFCENFGVTPFNIIGKSYDFLFSDLDLDYYSEDQLEYVRLIKSVKDFFPASVIINLPDSSSEISRSRFKVTFIPDELKSIDIVDSTVHRYAIVVFEKLVSENFVESKIIKTEKKSANVTLLKNLERTLRNERLLREIGSLVIADLPIAEIGQKIARTLCEYLRVDRCLIHDYHDGRTNFVAEYCTKHNIPMSPENADEEAVKILTDYINFQNDFYHRFGNHDKKSSFSIIENVTSDRNFSPIREICEKFFIVSQVVITTTINGKVNGGIYLHQSSQRTWLEDEIELLEMIADQFSIAVDRSDSIEKVMVANHALMEKTQQLKEALEHEQEMRKMQNEFVALVSHEFKTPLQIIDSTREVLFRKIKAYNVNDEIIDKALERIKNGIQRMNGLIQSTLNLAKMENGENAIKVEKSRFDLKHFVADIIEKNSNLATAKNIRIISKINELPNEFEADPKLLDHAFTNVISNAIKYSKPDSVVKILAKANDAKVALRVVDKGIGIPQDDLKNIGQKFFRAKNTLSVPGSGIGIYLTKHFIELHGGDVLIESEAGAGTSVTVTLPRN
jgi:signal transduction histidine kinase